MNAVFRFFDCYFTLINPHLIEFQSDKSEAEDSHNRSLTFPFSNSQVDRLFNDLIKPIQSEIIRYKGKHMSVFGILKHPTLIFKEPTLKSAQSMLLSIAAAQKVVTENRIQTCIIPRAQIIEKEGKHFFVMDKLPGLTHGAAQEAMEQEFEQIPTSPKMRKKWEAIMTGVTKVTCKLGYWDMSFQNIVFMKEGWGFIDWEEVEPSMSCIYTGMKRLFSMAPAELFDTICSVADSCIPDFQRRFCEEDPIYDYKLGQQKSRNLTEFKQEIADSFTLRSEVRSWYRAQEIDQKSVLKPLSPGDLFFPEESWEKRILDQFNENLKNKEIQINRDLSLAQNLINVRMCQLSQLSGGEMVEIEKPSRNGQMVKESVYQHFSLERKNADRISLEEALNFLQSAHIICRWSYIPGQGIYIVYA